MVLWTEITNFDTVQFSDSSEISPNGELCITCCYQLEESSKSRNGSILLMKLDDKSTNIVSKDLHVDGILDSCWSQSNGFILAGSLGCLYYYNVNESYELNRRKTVEIDVNSLCLSIDFHSNRTICSTSAGEIVLLDKDENIFFRHFSHSYEAWVAHLSRHDENLYYSGGDDCKFNGFDLRCGDGKMFSKSFEMGCTSIQSHPTSSFLLSTGSYDETFKIWDLRTMRSPIKSFNVGGGVWRHKWCPEGGALVLVAGMYGGFAVVRTDCEDDYLILPTQSSHTSGGLAYGADWIKSGNEYLICASSFYDHLWSLSRLALS